MKPDAIAMMARISDSNVQRLGLQWYADYETNQNQHGYRSMLMVCCMSQRRAM